MQTTRLAFMENNKPLAKLLKTATDRKNPVVRFNYLAYDKTAKKLYASNTKILVAIRNIDLVDLEEERQYFLDIVKGGSYLPEIELNEKMSDFERLLEPFKGVAFQHTNLYALISNSERYIIPFMNPKMQAVLNAMSGLEAMAYLQKDNMFYIAAQYEDYPIEILIAGSEI